MASSVVGNPSEQDDEEEGNKYFVPRVLEVEKLSLMEDEKNKLHKCVYKEKYKESELEKQSLKHMNCEHERTIEQLRKTIKERDVAIEEMQGKVGVRMPSSSEVNKLQPTQEKTMNPPDKENDQSQQKGKVSLLDENLLLHSVETTDGKPPFKNLICPRSRWRSCFCLR